MINPEFQIGDRVICRALDYRSDDDRISEVFLLFDGASWEMDGVTYTNDGDAYIYRIASNSDGWFGRAVLFPYQPPATKSFHELIQNPMEFPIDSTERHTETEPCNHAEFTASQTRNSTSA